MIFLDNVAKSASHGGATSEVMNVEHTILLPDGAVESTHYLASLLMQLVHSILDVFGLEHYSSLVAALYAVIVIALAFGVGAIVKWILLKIVNKFAGHYDSELINNLRSVKFFSKISRIIPPLIFLVFIELAFAVKGNLSMILTRGGWIYVVATSAIAINAFVESVFLHINEQRNKKNLPLKGLLQLLKWVVWIIGTIVIVAIIVNKSPATLFAGLGAFAAVLMLVFKDSILGVVAGVQLAENDMVREGDWIKVDGTTANGTVKEVSLITVKVLNWDKTITTLPTYSLITGTFQNYRNMQESGTRRIMRKYFIDADSVRFVDDTIMEEVRKIPLMAEYIAKKSQQRENGVVENVDNSESLVDGTIDTNLGLFRAYMKMYLDNNPNIDPYSLKFVNTFEPTPNGIPLQVYCFTTTSVWASYEAIQSEVFEHIAAMLPKFHLYTFENPSGRDSVNEGYLESGRDASDLFGLPYPFLRKK